MTRRLPVVATVIVLLAVVIMVGLGFWQIARLHEKEAMIARYTAALALNSDVAWPRNAAQRETALYRHGSFTCTQVLRQSAQAGRSATGASGWAHVAACRDGPGEAQVVLGWSRAPASPAWSGGEVRGFIAGSAKAIRLIADPPLAGLQANAAPDPRDLPNNHFAYAVQWFLFAATALVIYAIAVRKRMRGVG